jgi:hypothetical protein
LEEVPEGVPFLSQAREARNGDLVTIYLCERCGSRFNSARFAHIEMCPRCLLRDDVSSHLVFVPGDTARRPADEPKEPEKPIEPDAPGADLS